MSIRSDITIDWNLSPRIIEVAITSTEVQMQDLIDTLREAEEHFPNLSYFHIVDSSGKESLGGGVSIGITLKLRNAQLKFADRGGPSFVICYVTGGNLVAVDSADYPMEPIATSDYVQVIMIRSAASTVVETGVSGLTQEESNQLAVISTVDTHVNGLSGDVAKKLSTGQFLALK